MCGHTTESYVGAVLSRNDVHNGERKIEIVENRPLLDMDFKIAQGVGGRLRIRNTIRFQTETTNHVAHGSAAVVCPIEQRGIKRSDQRPAAEEWDAEADAFLV